MGKGNGMEEMRYNTKNVIIFCSETTFLLSKSTKMREINTYQKCMKIKVCYTLIINICTQRLDNLYSLRVMF